MGLDLVLEREARLAAARWSPRLTPGPPTLRLLLPPPNEVPHLPHRLPDLHHTRDEFALLDGHPTDDTLETASRLCPDIRIVLAEERGKGAALQTGLEACTSDIVVMLDADGSNDP